MNLRPKKYCAALALGLALVLAASTQVLAGIQQMREKR